MLREPNRIALALGNWRRSGVMLGIAMAITATMADLFFYGHPIGWTAGGALLLMLGLVLLRSSRPRDGGPIRVLVILCAALAAALIEEPTRLNVACAIAAIGTLAIALRSDMEHDVAGWCRRWGGLLVGPIVRPLVDGRLVGRWVKRHPRSLASPLRLIGLWVIPVTLAAVFLCLFAIANPIVEKWLRLAGDQINRLITEFEQLIEPDRVALWLCAAATTYALLRASRKFPRRLSPALRPTVPVPIRDDVIAIVPETSIVIRCLALFNLLFAVETTLDVVYLWGGRTLPNGLNHIQYAHRGAYPLIATALLAGIFVLITFRRNAQTSRHRAARVLVYFWIAQNVVLTLSAAWRLWLLVDTSLLTRLRLATSIWLLLVAAGLVSLIWRIARDRDNAWLIRHNLGMAALTLYACCFLNLDGFIASWNAEHCDFLRHGATAGSLAYFQTLGEESLPALQRLSETLDTTEGRAAAMQLHSHLADELCGELQDWRGWTWRRARLFHAISTGTAPAPAFARSSARD